MLLAVLELGNKADWIAVEAVAAFHDLDPVADIGRGAHIDRQAKAVEQLRAQFAFFRVAAADQDEARRVTDGKPFALDDVGARHGDIEQQIDEVIFKQVDFIDVEKTAIGLGEQAGFEALLAGGQRAFEIEAANDAIFRGAQRQIDEGNGAFFRLLASAFAAAFDAGAAIIGSAFVTAAGHDLHRRQQTGQRAHGGGFAGAAIAEHHDTAQPRFHCRQQQRLLHLGLANNGGERKRSARGRCHARCLKRQAALLQVGRRCVAPDSTPV